MPSRSRPSVKLALRTARVMPDAPGIGDVEIFDGEQGLAHDGLRIEHVAQPVSQKIEAEADDEDGDAGNGRDPPLVEDHVAAGRDHGAPFRRGRLRAEAEEAEACRGEDDACHVERQAHDDRGQAQRHDVPEQDAPGGSALQHDGLNEIALGDGDRFGARDAGIGRPGGERNGDHRVLDAGAKRCREGQRQHQAREGEEDIGDAHQHRIDPAAEVARERADREADGGHHHRHQQHDGERHPRAIEGAGIDVAAKFIGAEPVFGRRRRQPVGEILRDGRNAARQQRREDRHEDEQER